MKYKVLFFDSWKGGIHHFLRLIPAFIASDFDTLLIHLGSWGNEPHIIKEEFICGLLVRDVSFYKNQQFNSILKLEKPNIVVFLSTATLAHRAFIRYCNILDIPTVHLFHGLVRVQKVDNGVIPYKINKFAYTKFFATRLPKVINKTLPTYIRALVATKAGGKDWKTFLGNLIHYITKPSIQKVAADAKTTICLVYADADRKYAMEKYSFTNDKIFAVGNPDLIQFDLQTEVITSNVLRSTNNCKQVIYIDTALRATGLVFKNDKEYLQHLSNAYEILQKQGFNLLLKPHPETKRLLDLSSLKAQGMRLVENAELVTELRKSCAVFVEPSTLSIVPAIMGLPLALVQFGKAADLEYGVVLTSYPRSFLLKNLNDFPLLLENFSKINRKNPVRTWTKLNAGPLPAEDMPKRVVSNIFNLLISSS